MRKKIINTMTDTYETREYMLVNPSWSRVLLKMSQKEAGTLFINLCLKYGRQINHNLIDMDDSTKLVFEMMLADQDKLDCIAKLPDETEWVDYEEEE